MDIGAIQVLCNAVRGGGVSFPEKKRYKGVGRGKIPRKNCYVTLEWEK